MTTKDKARIDNPWKIWPDGIIPAEDDRPEMRLRTPEEAKRMLAEMAESRRRCKLPEGVSSLDLIRQERDEN